MKLKAMTGILLLSMFLLIPSIVSAALESSSHQIGIVRTIGQGKPRPMTSTSVTQACEADGATIETAISAFEYQNPHLVPSEARLLSRKNGGPYLENWSHNSPYYTYRLTASGKLMLAVPSGATFTSYRGPQSCTSLNDWTQADFSLLGSCEADGATIETAISAFEYQNPHLVPSEARLLSRKNGGPYLENWSHNSPYYTYRLTASGKLMLAVPSGATFTSYRGPQSCESRIWSEISN